MVRGSLSPLALRKDAVKFFGKSISEQFNVGETTVEKISQFEFPEKWIVRNDDWAECIRGTQYHLTGIAIRVLLDAFLYLLGYRPIEWTPEEKAAWEEKKREFNSTRSCAVETSKDRLIEFGFTEAEIAALFSANFRMDMNTAAHSMEARTMVFLLKNMRIKAVYRNALEKVFAFICGVKMNEVAPDSNLVITTTGVSMEESGYDWLFEETTDQGIGNCY
ncbi:hypothetical protein V8E54_013944 [Elaphomyces granulatus]